MKLTTEENERIDEAVGECIVTNGQDVANVVRVAIAAVPRLADAEITKRVEAMSHADIMALVSGLEIQPTLPMLQRCILRALGCQPTQEGR